MIRLCFGIACLGLCILAWVVFSPRAHADEPVGATKTLTETAGSITRSAVDAPASTGQPTVETATQVSQSVTQTSTIRRSTSTTDSSVAEAGADTLSSAPLAETEGTVVEAAPSTGGTIRNSSAGEDLGEILPTAPASPTATESAGQLTVLVPIAEPEIEPVVEAVEPPATVIDESTRLTDAAAGTVEPVTELLFQTVEASMESLGGVISAAAMLLGEIDRNWLVPNAPMPGFGPADQLANATPRGRRTPPPTGPPDSALPKLPFLPVSQASLLWWGETTAAYAELERRIALLRANTRFLSEAAASGHQDDPSLIQSGASRPHSSPTLPDWPINLALALLAIVASGALIAWTLSQTAPKTWHLAPEVPPG